MKICFIADSRSPIAKSWIRYFARGKHRITIISTYPSDERDEFDGAVYDVPIAFSQLSAPWRHRSKPGGRDGGPRLSPLAALGGGAWSRSAAALRMWLGGLDVSRHAIVARKIIETVSPDVVHALRIPFEGILAAAATPPGTPLILSVWGNDFTMFASRYPMIGTYTDDSLRRADALLCDCRRDLDLAVTRWGFDRDKPCEVLPGGGGVSLHDFNTGASTTELRIRLGIPPQAPVVLNPRGFRSYIDPELFFEAVRLVVDELPDVVCVCIGQQHVRASEDSVRRLGISGNVRLTSSVPHAHMADFFRLAEISVSPATHDGTPNTLLEAMACGSFPIAGELESIREWIADGVNGLLCDVSNPASLARAMIRSLRDHDLRQKARELNSAIVAERADYENVMPRAEEFYYRVIARKNGGNSNLSICAAS